jgi:hypothetical protein
LIANSIPQFVPKCKKKNKKIKVYQKIKAENKKTEKENSKKPIVD